MQDLSRTIPARQQQFVEDGVLTYTEYETAALAEIQCLRDAGVGIVEESVKITSRAVNFTMLPHDPDELAQARTYCVREYSKHVVTFWSYFTRPTEEELAAARSALAACLVEHGVEVSNPPSGIELAGLANTGNQAYNDCTTKIQAEHDLPGFGG